MNVLVGLVVAHLAGSRHCNASAARRPAACPGVRVTSAPAASATASGTASLRASDCCDDSPRAV